MPLWPDNLGAVSQEDGALFACLSFLHLPPSNLMRTAYVVILALIMFGFMYEAALVAHVGLR
jgi:hypothetical protein